LKGGDAGRLPRAREDDIDLVMAFNRKLTADQIGGNNVIVGKHDD
jgi:hypothetical protein